MCQTRCSLPSNPVIFHGELCISECYHSYVLLLASMNVLDHDCRHISQIHKKGPNAVSNTFSVSLTSLTNSSKPHNLHKTPIYNYRSPLPENPNSILNTKPILQSCRRCSSSPMASSPSASSSPRPAQSLVPQPSLANKSVSSPFQKSPEKP